MPQQTTRLPLDAAHYTSLRVALRDRVAQDPELPDIQAFATLLQAHREAIGELTLTQFETAPEDVKRQMVHYMVLGASELKDLHDVSRMWLQSHGMRPPPWDLSAPRSALRMIPYGTRVGATVEWEPENRVNLNPQLNEQEQRWVLAMAIGAGERPQWSNEDIKRYAAYLTMPEHEFRASRDLSDEQLADKYQVPLDAVRYRRTLPDELP